MFGEPQESMNATLTRLLRAISDVDTAAIEACCTTGVVLNGPGARAVDLTRKARVVTPSLPGLKMFVVYVA